MSTNLVNLAQQAAGQPSSGGNLLQLAQQAKGQDPNSASARFGKSFAEAAGIPTHTGTLAENLSELRHFGTTTEDALKAFWQQHLADVDTAKKSFHQPGAMNKIVGAEEYLESGIPFVGSNLIRGQEQLKSKDYAGATGTSLGTVVPFATGEAARLPKTAGEAVDASKVLGKEAIASKAAPHIEAAGDEVRGAVKQSLAKAESRVEPLYKNLHEADAKELAKSGKSGSVNVTAAREALAKSRQELFGDVTTKPIAKGESRLAEYEVGKESLSDLRTARSLRGELSDAIGSAKDRRTIAALKSARSELTEQMKARAKQLGLSKDFEKADAQWREIQGIRERLSPITDQENSAKLFDSYQNASPEVRNAMTKLSKEGLLDKGRMDKLNQLVQKVNKAMHPRYSNYIARMALGYLPARLGLDYLQRLGIVPKSSTGFMLPYAVGSGGYLLADLLKGRLSALKAIKELPELGESTSLEKLKPSRPKFPKAKAKTAASAAQTVARESKPLSDAERLRLSVPIELQPRSGEEPLLQALLALRQETQMNPEQERIAMQLEEELRKHGEKVRTKHRTEEATQEYKKRHSNPVP